VTGLLKAWEAGDASALSQLISMVYGDLRRMAATYMQHERVGHTLQPTALVHEVYQRLISMEPAFNDREHFFRCACLMMRRLLVKHARAHKAEKRRAEGGPLEPGPAFAPDADTVLGVHDVLDQLRELDPRLHHIVELRFFMGLTLAEIAAQLALSTRTVKREWATAKSWLAGKLKRDVLALDGVG
jgi:RNA polymerase sigma factor (TIGR02999 family)